MNDLISRYNRVITEIILFTRVALLATLTTTNMSFKIADILITIISKISLHVQCKCAIVTFLHVDLAAWLCRQVAPHRSIISQIFAPSGGKIQQPMDDNW